jgi:hypothetical protein
MQLLDVGQVPIIERACTIIRTREVCPPVQVVNQPPTHAAITVAVSTVPSFGMLLCIGFPLR